MVPESLVSSCSPGRRGQRKRILRADAGDAQVSVREAWGSRPTQEVHPAGGGLPLRKPWDATLAVSPRERAPLHQLCSHPGAGPQGAP